MKQFKGYIGAELNEFLIAQTYLISIVPNVEMNQLGFISGKFGPLRINNQIEVPFWMAIHLKKSNKCRIVIPSWMTLDKLKRISEDETTSTELTEVPDDYYEIGLMLLSACEDDIPNDKEIRLELDNINRKRDAKILKKFEDFYDQDEFQTFQCNNLQQHEKNKIFGQGYSNVVKLSMPQEESDSDKEDD
ncbi:DNA replication complex GINS protein PSF2 [Paramecium bursaria]